MNFNCHKLGGVTAGAIITYYAQYHHLFDEQQFHFVDDTIPWNFVVPVLLIYFSSYIASTLPDIDHPSSTHGKNHKKISQFLNKHGGHRGWTHYPFVFMCFTGIFYGIYYSIPLNNPVNSLFYWSFIGILGGWVSHIILDLFNKAGVSLLMPFSKIRVRIPSGITIKKGRFHWRYLRGGNALDDFLLIIICFFIFGMSIILINPQITIIIASII